jgi:hypothetical protein
MKIVSIRHRGLKRLVEADDPRELRRDLVARIRRVITALFWLGTGTAFSGRLAGASTS